MLSTPSRFQLPGPGAPASVAFPAVTRATLPNGVALWSVEQTAVPVVSFALVIDRGSASDPADRPGLASIVASLASESAGARDSIALADALARIGTHLDVQAAADITVVSMQTLPRHARAALAIFADVVQRPQFTLSDFARVRELRLSRLRQASRVASTIADRALIAGVFGDHPYGHGGLGTTRAVEQLTVDEVREWWSRAWTPAGATFVVSGDLPAAAARAEVERAFGSWQPQGGAAAAPALAPTASFPAQASRVIAVHRPGAAQAELRVGHLGPSRSTPDYHALVTLNALLGGQFTSRINRNLREGRAITYGARTGFDMRRLGGLFSCDTSVQADSAAVAAAEVVREFAGVAVPGAVEEPELDRARASLTRGYARQFETAAHLARALVDMAAYDLPRDAFDRFVPAIAALTPDDISRVARETLRPADSTIVVVTDLDAHRAALDALERPLTVTEVEF